MGRCIDPQHRRRPAAEGLEGRVLFAAGDLDSTFGDPSDPGKSRVVVSQPATPDDAAAMGVLPDGKIVVAGQTGGGVTQFGVVRLDAGGFPDASFGNGGRVTQSFGGSQAGATALLRGPDGQVALSGGGIVVGGFAKTSSGGNLQFALARYTTAGAPDPSFGQTLGRQLTAFPADARIGALALQGDEIVAAGTVGTGPDNQIALARYTANGQPDVMFGDAGDGTTLTGIGGEARAMAVLGDGSLVVAGRSPNGTAVVAVFNPGGMVVDSFEDTNLAAANGLVVLSDGTLLLAGPSSASIRPLDSDFAVVHRGQNGEPDPDFGGGDGVATVDVGGAGANDEANAIALAPDGGPDGYKIVVAGSTNVLRNDGGSATQSDFAVARLNADGSPDTTFGNNGSRSQTFALFDSEGVPTVSTGKAVAVQGDGKVVVAGTVPSATLQPTGGGQRGVVTRFGLVRFIGAAVGSGGTTGSISGIFYNDLNRNGRQDPGEPPVAGMTAYFDRNDNADVDPDEPSAVSGPDGRYTIANLPPARYYRIREVRGSLTRTEPAGTFPLGFYDVTLAAGEQSTGNDFGNFDPTQAAPANNAAPVANADRATTAEGKAVDVDVLANDTDDNPVNLLTVTVTRQPAHGTAVFNPAIRKITYTPAEGFGGDESFGYKVTDTGNKSSAEAAVSVKVTPAVPPATLPVTVEGQLPASAVGGQKARATLTVRVSNPTTQLVNGSERIELFASADDALDAGDASVAMLDKPLKLKPGAAKALKVKVSSFPVVADGSYRVLAKATGPDGTFDVKAAPGAVAIARPTLDLAPSITSAFAKPVAAGGRGTAAVVIANRGNITAAGTGMLVLSASADATAGGADDQLIATVPVRLKVKNGKSKTVKVRAALPPTLTQGSYFLVARVEPPPISGVVNAGGEAAVSASPFTVL